MRTGALRIDKTFASSLSECPNITRYTSPTGMPIFAEVTYRVSPYATFVHFVLAGGKQALLPNHRAPVPCV